MTQAELEKLGIERQRLVFANDKIDQRAQNIPKLQAEAPQLKARIQEIYEYVNMAFQPLCAVRAWFTHGP